MPKTDSMGRKRNQGKARRAAKAKQEAEEWEDNNQMAAIEGRSQEAQLLARVGDGIFLPASGHDTTMQCNHGFDIFHNDTDNMTADFVRVFFQSFNEAIHKVDIVNSLLQAKNATKDKFAEVWKDSAKMESAISFFLCAGTDFILKGNDYDARKANIFARYMEQWTAVHLHKTQALHNIPKLDETCRADQHSLVKFFRHRIPCTCLDEKYEEVKCIIKVGLCYNEKCTLPNNLTERSKTMYCSRCRNITYCSRKCQEANWRRHRARCDQAVAAFAEFEDKKKS